MQALIPVFPDHTHMGINLLLQKARCCPDCGARYHTLIAKSENLVRAPRYVVTCGECHYQGPFGRGLEDAMRRWNKPPGFFATLVKRWRRKHTPRHMSDAHRKFGAA